MKLISKLLIVALCSAPIIAGVATPIALRNESNVLNAGQEKVYSVSKYGKILNINSKTLMFEVSDESGTTWLSSDVKKDDRITSYRKAFLESALTVYFMTSEAGESNFSIFDSAHKNVTKVRIGNIDGGFEVKCIIIDGPKANPNLSIDVKFEIKLVEKGLSLKISEIKEYDSKNKLSKLVLYPAFASSYKQINGYMLIPDGSGAIIDLSKTTSAKTLLSLPIYDSDIGLMDNDRKATTSEILTLPMYAINEENKSTLAYLVSGDEYATLNTKAAGIIDNYNYSYFSFDYRDIYYSYQGIGESTRAPKPQEKINEFTPEIIYELIPEKLEYYDFAKRYQDHLISSNVLSKASNLKSDIRLEFLMAENKPSMFGKEVFKMTSASFIKDKVNELLNKNIKPSVALLGYANGGLTNSYPTTLSLENKTGSDKSYKELAEFLSNNNLTYSFIVDFIRSYETNSLSKYDLAMNMSEKYIQSNDYNVGNKTKYNQLILNKTKDLLTKASSDIDKYNIDGFDFLSIGSKLYSSYFNQVFSRTEAKASYIDMMDKFIGNVSLRKPNQYMFNHFDNYLEASYSNSGFILETESIPFMSMLLSGYKNMYSSPINLNYTGEEQILKLMDYNINPSFILTEESAIKLLDSNTNHIFSSQYSDWEEDLIRIYQKVNNVLVKINGANFIKREKIAANIVLNTYSNGKKILINYTNKPFTYNGIVVPGLESEVF